MFLFFFKLEIDNSPEVYASMMVDYESNRPEGYIVHITFSKDKDLPDIPAYYVTDDSHMALQDLTNETLNSVEEISQTSFRALGHGDPPAGWTCPPQYYMDGICDCDCGAVEPECPTGHCFPFHVAECGNTILEDTEECEVGGLGCSDDCRCAQGYTSVEKIDCEPVCGDGVVVEGEECDGVEFCNESCVCTDGYTPSQNQENECVPKKQIHDNDGGKSVGKLTVVLYTLLSVFIFVMIVFATVIYLIK